ncbi:RNA polymerase sigma factor [Actinomadura fibrosa]|uniref:RNA polymerase sigma factor n=1 Tax=Actinomadura fibrosa TaxID=111802 RepID=A0ABW2XNW5_9ACTN|nr:sigma-70 family RNA polymerase sigma factor [Actinomadura fibrosa]
MNAISSFSRARRPAEPEPPPPPLSDDVAALIAASREHPERFAELFDRHYAEIRRYIDRRLGADAADDLAAEVFLVAFRKRSAFDPQQGTPRAWLYGIATRLVSRHRRDERRRYRALARLGDEPSGEGHAERVEAQVAASAVGARLGRALAGLSSGDRDVLLLVALADLTYPEIAQALGIKYGTVFSRLSRARRQLRQALGDINPLADGE